MGFNNPCLPQIGLGDVLGGVGMPSHESWGITFQIHHDSLPWQKCFALEGDQHSTVSRVVGSYVHIISSYDLWVST